MTHTRAGTRRRCVVGYLLTLALALSLVACTGEKVDQETTEDAPIAGSYPLPGEQVFPEGISYQAETGDFFVSSTTDGTIYRGNVADEGEEAEVFLEPGTDGRSTAAGIQVDPAGKLFVAGGDTGRIFVYDTASGELVDDFDTPESEMTFINDVTVVPNGDAYFTDSMRPILVRVPVSMAGGVGEPEEWLDLGETPIEYGEGFNLNGIASTEDGRYLLAVQSNTGNLYRIDTSSKEVVRLDLGETTLENGDGLLLDGRSLYVVRNQQGLIVPIQLSEDFASGEVGEGFADPSLRYPTTIAGYEGRLLVVNSQFDRRNSGEEPDLPFTVSAIEVP